MLNWKILKGKQNGLLWSMRFENILVPENIEKQNPIESYTKIDQKYIACSFAYKLVNVLMIHLVRLLSHVLVSMLFTTLLFVWLRKVNIAVMWWKKILTKSL